MTEFILESSEITANSRALDQNEERRQNALDALNILDTLPEVRFDRITRLARALFGVETVNITLVDHDRQWFKSSIGGFAPEGPRSSAFCDTTIRTSETLVVENATLDARFMDNPLVTGAPSIRFYAGHPLEAPGGERVGALCVIDSTPRTFTEPERALLKDLALWVQSEISVANEIDRAAQVQKLLLPVTMAVIDGYELAGASVPAHTVGGDFFDWYASPDGLTFTLADVMGKGIDAAITAATIRAVLRSATAVDIATAAQLASRALASEFVIAGTFVTMFHAQLVADSGEVRYVDAGHGLTVLIHADGTWQRLSTSGLPLGIDQAEVWTVSSVLLEPGDLLVSLSDGVLDLFDGTLASIDALVELIRLAPSAQAVVDRLMALPPQVSAADDLTVLVVKKLD